MDTCLWQRLATFLTGVQGGKLHTTKVKGACMHRRGGSDIHGIHGKRKVNVTGYSLSPWNTRRLSVHLCTLQSGHNCSKLYNM